LLTTARLELWQPQVGDRPLLEEMMAAEPVHRYLGGMNSGTADTFARLLRNAGAWALYGYGTFMLREPGQSALAGTCGIFPTYRGLGEDFDDKPEAGWILAESHHGRGLAREAMDAILTWFEAAQGPQDIVCLIDPRNAPSLALAAKLGFLPTRMAEMPQTGEPVQLLVRQPIAE
jgi:RimJ/RimL family protein N-acetyltransferase